MHSESWVPGSNLGNGFPKLIFIIFFTITVSNCKVILLLWIWNVKLVQENYTYAAINDSESQVPGSNLYFFSNIFWKYFFFSILNTISIVVIFNCKISSRSAFRTMRQCLFTVNIAIGLKLGNSIQTWF